MMRQQGAASAGVPKKNPKGGVRTGLVHFEPTLKVRGEPSFKEFFATDSRFAPVMISDW